MNKCIELAYIIVQKTIKTKMKCAGEKAGAKKMTQAVFL